MTGLPTGRADRSTEGAPAYLDNAATTDVRPEVAQAMLDVLLDHNGNPSSEHARGQEAKLLLEESREVVAGALGVDPDEVFFTSGATEANNLAIRGVCAARARAAGSPDAAGRVIASTLEHASVTRSVRGLRRDGWTTLHVDAVGGDLDLGALERSLCESDSVALVTMMTVQNEMGYVFPIDQVAELTHRLAPNALVHTDAVQAFGKFPVRPRESGVDLASVASHKLGGPKGIGALYAKRGTVLFTNAFGGGQERGLRSGTEPVFLAVGFAEAVRCAQRERRRHWDDACGLRSRLLGRLHRDLPQVVVHSRSDGSPYIVSFAVPGMDNKRAVSYLSDRGVYVSRASACTSNHSTVPPGTWREKHPLSLQAAGVPLELGKSTLRVSFGFQNTSDDVDRLVDGLVSFLREAEEG